MSSINPKPIKSADFNISQFKAILSEKKDPVNRGYVRISADGSSLEKVSKHWYSLPFHGLRSRVSAEYNTAMRKAFVDALHNDMKYLAPDFTKEKSLADRVLNTRKDGKSVTNTESLSRKEVAAILEAHSERINSVAGRKEILKNLFSMTAQQHTCADVELFKSYMGVDCEPLKSRVQEAQREKKLDDGKYQMAMSEMEFRHLISDLEEAAATAGCRVKADAGLKNLTLAHLQLDSDVGFSYDLDNSTALSGLRGALVRTLKTAIDAIPQKETVGGGVKYLNLFLKHVLPTMIRRATADIKAMGFTQKDNPEEFNALFEEHCGFNKINELAKNFLDQAAKGLKNPDEWREQLKNSFGDNNKVSRFFSTACNIGFTKEIAGSIAWTTLKEETRKDYAEKIINEYMDALPQFEKELVDDLFVKSFLVQQFGDDAEQKVKESGIMAEKMQQHRDNVVLALKINLGERIVQNGKKADSRGGLVSFTEKIVDGSLERLLDGVPNISEKTIQQLFQFTLPNIINTRIKNVQDKVSSTLKLPDHQSAYNSLITTGKCLTKFSEKVDAEKAKLRKAMNNLITATMKKGGWEVSLEERNLLLAELDRGFDDMCETSIRDFLTEGVYGESNLEDELKAATESLLRRFEAGKSELRGTLLNRLKVMAFSHMSGPKQKEALKNGAMEALTVVKTLNDDLRANNKTSLDEAQLNALSVGELQRVWDEKVLAVLAKQPKDAPLPDDVVDKVRKSFEKEVPSILKKAISFVEKFEKELQTMVGVTVDAAFSKDGLFETYVDPSVSKDELKKLKDWMKNSILASLSEQKSQIELEQLRNPSKKVGSGQIDNIVDHLLGSNGKGNILHAMVRLGTTRSEKVLEYAKNNTYAEQISKALKAELEKADVDLALKTNVHNRLTFSERSNLLERVTGDITKNNCEGTLLFARAQKFPMLYPSELNEKNGFINQVQKEAGDKLDALVADYRKFRSAFIEQATSAHGPETDYSALGPEKLKKARNYMLDRLSKMDPLPKLDVELGLYRAVLKKMTDNKIDATQKKFEEFAAKYESVYEQIMPVIRNAFDHDDVQMRLEEAGAPKDAIKLVFDTLLPRYMSNIAEDIGQNPDLNVYNAGRKKIEEDAAKNYVTTLVDRIASMRIDTDEGLCNLIKECGYEKELTDVPTKEMMLGNLRIWAKDEGVQNQRADMICASLREEMNKYQQGNYYQPNKEHQAAIKKFADTAKGVIGDMFRFAIVNKFDKDNVASAKLQIQCFVEEGWKLESKSVKQKIMQIFYERIEELMKKLAAGETLTDDDVILDSAFMRDDEQEGTLDRINTVVNTAGRNQFVFQKLQNQVMNQHLLKICEPYRGVFDPNRVLVLEDGSKKVQTMKSMAQVENTKVLLDYFEEAVAKCSVAYTTKYNTYHSAVVHIDEYEKMVAEEIDKGIQPLLTDCVARVECANLLPELRLNAEIDLRDAILAPGLTNGAKFVYDYVKTEKRNQQNDTSSKENFLLNLKFDNEWHLSQTVVNLIPDAQREQLELFVGFVQKEYTKRMDSVSQEIYEKTVSDKRDIVALLDQSNKAFFRDLMNLRDVPPELKQKGFANTGIMGRTGWVESFLDKMASTLKKLEKGVF